MKLVAGWSSGSVALVSSGLDSLMDTASSLMNLIALRISERPPDHEHRYGHGKAEALASLFQALLIGGSALWVCVIAVDKLVEPAPLMHTGWSLVIMAVSLGATAGLIWYLRRAASRTDSLALRADAVHYETDLYTGAGVLLSLGVNLFIEWPRLDAVVSLALVLLIVTLAFQVGQSAVNQLMDRELPPAQRRAIMAVIERHYPQILGFHDLRTRLAGPTAFVDCHLEIDRRLSFEQAHDLSERVIAEIREAIPNANVTVHTDPVEPS